MDSTTAAPSPSRSCRMTRSELERLLKESGYGANTMMFSAYFLKQHHQGGNGGEGGGGPPVCAVCHRMIGEHDEPPSQAETTDQPILMATPAMVGHVDDFATTRVVNLDVGLPGNLKENLEEEGVDVAEVGYSPIFAVIAGFLLFIGVVLLIAFGASGLLVAAPATCAAPIILTLTSFFLLLFLNKSRVEFDHKQRIVRYSFRSLVCCCCMNSDDEISFDDLGDNVEGVMTNVKINKVPVMNAVMTVKDNKAPSCDNRIRLQNYMQGETEVLVQWQMYLTTRIKRHDDHVIHNNTTNNTTNNDEYGATPNLYPEHQFAGPPPPQRI